MAYKIPYRIHLTQIESKLPYSNRIKRYKFIMADTPIENVLVSLFMQTFRTRPKNIAQISEIE